MQDKPLLTVALPSLLSFQPLQLGGGAGTEDTDGVSGAQ